MVHQPSQQIGQTAYLPPPARVPTSAAELAELAAQKVRSSGLTDDHADALKLEVLTAAQAQQAGAGLACASLKIPYFDFNGNTTSFYRLRYLHPPAGFAGTSAKPPRYVQPPGTLNEVYLPPLLPRSWGEVLTDKDEVLYITEGEFKAAAGCAAGLATIGLGGVDVWRSQKRGLVLLPQLEAIKWLGRSIVIVFDSDAANNVNVCRAQRQLSAELCARGALPRICSLPPAKDGSKQGLDDYLLANGADALRALILDSPAFPEAKALWEMNEEVAYIKDPGLIVVRETGQRLSPMAFEKHAFANRHVTVMKTTAKAIVPVKMPLAPRWVEWEQRFELDKITYAPGKPSPTDNCWNTWRGWGAVPSPGSVAPWTWLLNFVFNGKPAERDWFEKWVAYPIQHPGEKLFTAAVVWGREHGTGKTLIGHTLLRIYGANGVEIKDRDLKGAFNSWAVDRQFVVGDEVTGSDKRDHADALKSMITQRELHINVKYLPTYTVPDCINYFFTSNHPDAFFLEDTDRRFFIHELVGHPATRQEYDDYDRWYKSTEGISALFHHLLHVDLAGFDPHAEACSTVSKINMIVDNKSDIGAWCLDLKEDLEVVLLPLGERASKECCIFSAAQLLRLYDPELKGRVTSNGLSRELKRAGFRQAHEGAPVRTAVGAQRLFVLRNEDVWVAASPLEVAAHWNEHFVTNKKF